MIFSHSSPKKSYGKPQKNAGKSPAKASQTDASALRVHRNLEKSLAKFLKCTKKTKKTTVQRKSRLQITQCFLAAVVAAAVAWGGLGGAWARPGRRMGGGMGGMGGAWAAVGVGRWRRGRSWRRWSWRRSWPWRSWRRGSVARPGVAVAPGAQATPHDKKISCIMKKKSASGN